MTFTEIFNHVCPMYILYGMTYEQFWYGDPAIAKAYREAHLLRRKMHNEELWIAGMYNYRALAAVIDTAFGKKREEYVKKPFDIFPKTELEKKEEVRNKKRKLIEYLNSWRRKAEKNKSNDNGS